MIETKNCSVIDTAPPQKKTHQDGSNTIVKGCTTTLKEVAYPVRATNQKANQIKYYEVSILCLYLTI